MVKKLRISERNVYDWIGYCKDRNIPLSSALIVPDKLTFDSPFWESRRELVKAIKRDENNFALAYIYFDENIAVYEEKRNKTIKDEFY